MISWKMGDLRGELPQVCVQPKCGHRNLPASLCSHQSFAAPQEVSCLLLATPSHINAQGFVQPCGELGQGHDPIKSCAERHRKQVLTRQFPDSPQMPVLGKEGFGLQQE